MKQKCRKKQSGQAVIETGLALSFIIWLLYYAVNAFHAIHTAHIGQKYAAMNLYQRLDNASKFVVDAERVELHGQQFMGVRFTDEEGSIPRRRILLDGTNSPEIRINVGICLEPSGTCEP